MPPPLSPAERAREVAHVRSWRRSDLSVRRQQLEDTRVADKCAWIATFIAEGRAASYPVAEEDLAEENTIDAAVRVTVSWLAAEIDRALAHAEVDMRVDARTLAWQLLGSYDPELYCDVGHVPPAKLAVDRLLAHVEWLGLRLPRQVAGSIARRLFLGLANQLGRPPEANSETEFCAECGATFPTGEWCQCPQL